MAAKVQIETEFIDTGAQAGLKKVGMSLTDLNSGFEIAKKAVGMMGEAYNVLVGDLLAYSDQVRDLSRVTGASTEESSRLIQVADDLQVEYGTLTAAAKALAKDGIALTTEELAKSSDEYLKITDAGARSEYAIKKFGRAGLELTKILEQGGDTLRNMAAAQDKNLVLTEAQTQAARDLQIAQDGLEDSIQGVKYALANFLIPVMNAAIKTTEQLTAIQSGYSDVLKLHSENVSKTATSYEDYRTEMAAAAVRAGNLVSATGEVTKTTIEANGAIKTIKVDVNLLTEAQWLAVNATKGTKQALDEAKAAADIAKQGYNELETQLGSTGAATKTVAATFNTELRDSIGNVTRDMQNYTAQLLFNQAAAGLDAEGSRLLAENMGLISPATSIAMGMLAKFKKQLEDKQITLAEYIALVRELDASVRNLPASKDINITTRFRSDGNSGGYADPGTGSTYINVTPHYYKGDEPTLLQELSTLNALTRAPR